MTHLHRSTVQTFNATAVPRYGVTDRNTRNAGGRNVTHVRGARPTRAPGGLGTARAIPRIMQTQPTRTEILAIIDTYDGMIKLAWERGERALDLLAARQGWVARLAAS